MNPDDGSHVTKSEVCHLIVQRALADYKRSPAVVMDPAATESARGVSKNRRRATFGHSGFPGPAHVFTRHVQRPADTQLLKNRGVPAPEPRGSIQRRPGASLNSSVLDLAHLRRFRGISRMSRLARSLQRGKA